MLICAEEMVICNHTKMGLHYVLITTYNATSPQGSIIVHPKQLNLLCQYNFADIIKNTHDDMLILLFCLRANNFNSPGGRESECVSVCMRERKWEHGEMMGECKRHSSDEGAPGEK